MRVSGGTCGPRYLDFMRAARARREPRRAAFQLILIKPSHYDDEGYVIQWLRSAVPSNSLGALYGLGQDCARRQVLGPDIDIDRLGRRRDQQPHPARPHPAPDPPRRRPRHGRAGRRADQPVSPRAGHRAAVAGGRDPGLHRRIPRLRLPRDAAGAAGRHPGGAGARHLAVRRRRRGGRLDEVLRDAFAGTLQADLRLPQGHAGPGGRAGAVPAARAHQAHLGLSTSFDAGRGCPFQCSFCTIINVQGRKSRYRSPDDVDRIIRAQPGAGHQAVLHHRRQLRPQPRLGADLRPADRAAGARGPGGRA